MKNHQSKTLEVKPSSLHDRQPFAIRVPLLQSLYLNKSGLPWQLGKLRQIREALLHLLTLL